MRTIELKWICKECDTKHILGRHKTCPTCGAPREKGEMEMDGLSSSDYTNGYNNAPTVTDPKLLDMANAGYDWFCKHCASGNRGDGHTCAVCGAPKDSIPDPQTPPAPYRKDNPFVSRLPSEEDDPVLNPDPMSGDRNMFLFGTIGTIGVSVAGLFLLLFWLFTVHDYPGVVNTTTWKHTVVVERWTPTVTRLWYFNTYEAEGRLPVAGQGEIPDMHLVAGSCRSEHYTNEQYVCGSHQVCHPVNRTVTVTETCMKSESYTCGETCTSTHNGFATCHTKTCTRSVPSTCTKSKSVFDHNECHSEPDYCTRPIYKDKCDYSTHRWVVVDTLVKEGHTDPEWPSPVMGPLDRSSRHSEYHVGGVYGSHYEWEIKPEMTDEFLRWKEGMAVTVHARNSGSISGVDPR